MTRGTKALAAAVTAALVCCGEDRPSGYGTVSPYGVWISDLGYSVIVTRNDTYTFCDSEKCFVGPASRPNESTTTLTGFLEREEAQAFLLRVFGGDEMLRLYRNRTRRAYGDALDFSSNLAADDIPGDCGRPECVIIGADEDAAFFRKVLAFDQVRRGTSE